jgi:uncharacterized protein YbbC (DUF1343 family)
LTAIFVPEHGLLGRIEAGKYVRSEKQTAIPAYSLYGATREPTIDMLKDIDLLIFDIQDVGIRFYTYISTMGLAMQAAAKARIPFWVLDRPNPLGGDYVSGFVLEKGESSFVGKYNIPIAHGMTVGELAQLIKGERMLPDMDRLQLKVQPMLGWERWMRWNDNFTNVWLPTSPNIRSFDAALLYGGIGFIEATSIRDGRGTSQPFQLLGAPWVDSSAMANTLNSKHLPGVFFEATSFSPQTSKMGGGSVRFEGQVVSGIKITVVDYTKVAPVEAGIEILAAFRDHARRKGQPELINQADWLGKLAGTKRLYRQLVVDKKSPSEIIASWKEEVESFKLKRKPYLIYKP